MTTILVSTIAQFDGLASVAEAAKLAHEADAVATGAPFLGATPFGIVAVDAEGRATLADTIVGSVISW